MTEGVDVGRAGEGRVHSQLRAPFHPIVDVWTRRRQGPAQGRTAAAECPIQTDSG
jgi:hypothetical protein